MINHRAEWLGQLIRSLPFSRLQSPGFDPSRLESSCHLLFHQNWVSFLCTSGLMRTSLWWISVPFKDEGGGTKGSNPLNTTVTGDKQRLQWVTGIRKGILLFSAKFALMFYPDKASKWITSFHEVIFASFNGMSPANLVLLLAVPRLVKHCSI